MSATQFSLLSSSLPLCSEALPAGVCFVSFLCLGPLLILHDVRATEGAYEYTHPMETWKLQHVKDVVQ